MTVRKEDLHDLVDMFTDNDQQSVYDFMRYLVELGGKRDPWHAIDTAAPDEEPWMSFAS